MTGGEDGEVGMHQLHDPTAIRVAVLGIGWAGTKHVEAIRELNRKLKVDCVVDDDQSFLDEQCAALRIEKRYTDWRKPLIDPEIDAVSICLPHRLHCEVAVASVESGVQVTILQSREVFVKSGLRGIIIYGDRGSIRTLNRGYEIHGPEGDPITAAWPESKLSD